MPNKQFIPTTLSYDDVKKQSVTFYTADGVEYRTPKNWHFIGKTPVEGAQVTVLTTKLGYEIKLYNSEELTDYDADADKKAKAEKAKALKEVNAEMSDLEKDKRNGIVSTAEYIKRSSEILARKAELL